MMTIQNFKSWLSKTFPHGDVVHAVPLTILDKEDKIEPYRVFLYTATNRYSIVAKPREDGGYLGCTASSRKSRAGEDWFRGNDLPDGPLTEETWQEILAGIVRYELQTICRADLKATGMGNAVATG